MSFGTLGLSILIHLALLLVASGWVLIQSVVPKIPPAAAVDNYSQLSTEPPPEFPDEIIEPNIPADSSDWDDSTPQTTGMPSDLIASNVANNNFRVPPSVGVYVPGAAIGSGTPAPSGGGKESAGLKKIAIGKIFDTAIESNQLGIMIDVSGSAHSYLITMVNELSKNFGDAIIFLVFGCGMSDNVAESRVKILDFARARPDPKLDGPDKRTTLQQIALAEKTSPAIAQMFKRLKTRGNVYYVYGGDNAAAQFAFKALLRKNVDTIYWFADFEDGISADWQKKILHDTKSKKVRVFIHNFSGRGYGAGMKFATRLAEATDGKVIITAPKKK
ncbi:MAG: hypothetical protein LBK60_04845 [Verrucomicrobiales bacterium]|nr:hypothetical protein [Verrucomicrobiales bacterium]